MHLVVAPRRPVIADPDTDVSKQVEAWVQQALAFQSSSTSDDLLRASNIYRRLIAGAPNHADSWHLLGLVRNAQGFSKFGAQCVENAVRLVPNAAIYRSNLIELQRAAGKPLAAIESLNLLVRDYSDYELPLDSIRALIDELRRLKKGVLAIDLFMRHQSEIFAGVRRLWGLLAPKQT